MAVEQEKENCPFLYNAAWQRSYLTDDTYKHLVTITSIISIATLLTIVLNAVIIFAVAAKRQLRSNSNILLACLASTDLITGLVVQPFLIAVNIERIYGEGPFCMLEKVSTIPFYGVCFASFFHLVLVCVDRYIATKYALRYQGIVTTQRITVCVVLAWGFTVLIIADLLVFAVIDSQIETEFYFVCMKVNDAIVYAIISVCIAFIVYAYRYIYSETRRQQKRLETEQLSHEEAKRLKKANKAASTVAFILGALILSYFSVIIIAVVTAYVVDITPSFTNMLWNWSMTIISLNSLLNPIIYCWRIKKLRLAFLEILHLRQPENNPPAIAMQAIPQHRPQVQPTSSEAFSAAMTVANQEPDLLSFSHLRAEEIVHIEGTGE